MVGGTLALALRWQFGSRQGSGPKGGRCPVKYRGNQSIYPEPDNDWLARKGEGQTDRWTDRRTDIWTDRHTHRFPPCSTGYRPLWVRCPAYFQIATPMLLGRARVPLTISCLWASFLVLELPNCGIICLWMCGSLTQKSF